MSNKKKVTVVVNKAWEYEPFFNAINHPYLHPSELPDPSNINKVKEPMFLPRAEMSLKNIDIVFRCVQNMMDPDVNKSNSEAKMKYMPSILADDEADLIISVSTAESTPAIQQKLAQSEDISINGSVIIGTQFFMSDERRVEYPDIESNLDVVPYTDYSNDISDALFERIKNNQERIACKFIQQKKCTSTYHVS